MNKVKINRLILEVGEMKLSLTEEEALLLRDKLLELFGPLTPSFPQIPTPIYVERPVPYPVYPAIWYTTCGDNTSVTF